MSRLPLTFASAPYDGTLPLYDGRVRAEGIDLNVVLLRYEDTFWRMLRHQEFDVSEMSLSSYFVSKENGPDFVALPVFLSRVFRHSSIYINRNAGIDRASDLRLCRGGRGLGDPTPIAASVGRFCRQPGPPSLSRGARPRGRRSDRSAAPAIL